MENAYEKLIECLHQDRMFLTVDDRHIMNRDINSEAKPLKYFTIPSLQQISAVNIIIALWSQSDVQHHVVKLFNKSGHYIDLPGKSMLKIWIKIGDRVLDGVAQLPVTNRIRMKISQMVDTIGLEIYNWIRVHAKYVFADDHALLINENPLDAVDYMDYLVWTSRGRIDYKGTAKKLLDTRQLSNNDQYVLACTNCLEDDIVIIAPKIIDTLFLESFEESAMVYFWTSRMTGDFTEMDREVDYWNTEKGTNYSLDECLFEVLIGDIRNRIAIKYIWGKLGDEEKSRHIGSAITRISDTDIRFYLVSQMTHEQQLGVFETYFSNIFLNLLYEYLEVKKFFPTIRSILNVISKGHYLKVLEGVVKKMDKIRKDFKKWDRYRNALRELWQYAPKHLKEYVIELEDGFRLRNILFGLFCRENVDLIQSILFDCDCTQRRNIIFSGTFCILCNLLMKCNQWDLIETILGDYLASVDDAMNRFKQSCVERGHHIAVALLRNKEWTKVEKFEKWVFKSEDEIKYFRKDLMNSRFCEDILRSIVVSESADFTELDRFVKWCALGDEGGAMRLKAEVSQICIAEALFCKLIKNVRYERLEQILDWCFARDRERIDQFKQNFCYDQKSFLILELVSKLIKRDDKLQSFQSFVCWCFTNEHEIDRFKKSILHPTLDMLDVFIDLLTRGLFDVAEEFIYWCYSSSQTEIHSFKNQLMCHDNVGDIFQQYHYDDNHNGFLTKVVSWFNPSKETAIRFKEKFMSASWFKGILPELNNFVQDHDVAVTIFPRTESI